MSLGKLKLSLLTFKEHGKILYFIDLLNLLNLILFLIREARVAKQLINLIKFGKIVASFPQKELASQEDYSMPELVDRATALIDGKVPEKGICSYCRSFEARQVCKNCVSLFFCHFYCSKEHQSLDWPSHKVDCFPQPDLISSSSALPVAPDSSTAETPKYNFVIPYVPCFEPGNRVEITYFKGERVLYLTRSNGEHSKLITMIENSAQSSANLTVDSETGLFALALSKGSYRRAQIIDKFDVDEDGNDLLCSFIDFGYVEAVSSRDLKRLSFKLRGLPCHTFKVILENIHTKNNVLVQNYLREIEKELLEVVSVDKRGLDLFVVLKRMSGEIVNSKIQSLGNCFQEPVDKSSKFARFE